MKIFSILSAIFMAVSLAQSPDTETSCPVDSALVNSKQCMYCKRADTYSSFLYSASYCKDTDECLLDQWNYKSKWCPSGWKRGWELDLDCDCAAQDGGIATC